MLSRKSSGRSVAKKTQYAIAAALFVIIVSRIVYLHYERHQLWKSVVGRKSTLRASDLSRFLGNNGVNITAQQLLDWMGGIDDEKDGFDQSEFFKVIDIVDDFQSASGAISSSNVLGLSAMGDAMLVLVLGAGIIYVVLNSDKLEKKVAANSFCSAVKVSGMQRKWKDLEGKFDQFQTAKSDLQSEMVILQEARNQAEQQAREMENAKNSSDTEIEEAHAKARQAAEQLKATRQELESAIAAQDAVEQELMKLRGETEQHMQVAHMSTQKLQAMHSILRGIKKVGASSPFHGAGEGQYSFQGATEGFAVEGTLTQPSVNRTSSGNQTQPSVNRTSSGNKGFQMESFIFGHPTEDDMVFYEVNRREDLLGTGADCAYRCRNVATGEQFALKIYGIDRADQKRQILNDLRTQQAIRDHEHVVKYHNVIETQRQIFVLMELIPGKDLFGHVVENKGLSERQAARIFVHICKALQFCHENDIVHGDVKPENVMVINPDSETPTAKLIDFGFACFLGADTVNKAVVDPYSPPEALTGTREATKLSDCFRLGCTLYIMLVATYPFDVQRRDIAARREGKVFQYPAWKKLSAEARDLVVRLLRDRISVQEAENHDWVRKFSDSP